VGTVEPYTKQMCIVRKIRSLDCQIKKKKRKMVVFDSNIDKFGV
jgi:hypothetical protein